MARRGDGTVRRKADGSPVTAADTDSERLIRSHLAGVAPQIPPVGEEAIDEGARPPSAKTFWLIDPLDGTKAYLRGEEEFTINIALITGGRAVLGVVYAPAMGRAFVAAEGMGAFQGPTPLTAADAIRVRSKPAEGLAVLTSNLHEPPMSVAKNFPQLKIDSVRGMSSSVKFCIIAAGEADFYPRRGPTMEWDTAAGQAVLEVAGGRVLAGDGETLVYGKPDFRNGAFVASGGD